MADKQSKADALRAMREANYAAKSSDGGSSDLGVIGKQITEQLPCRDETREMGKNHSPSGVTATLAVPSEAKPKRGRPRLGEMRPKPWLTSDPPMSARTWYRRQKQVKE